MPPKKNVYCGTKDKPPKGKTKGTLKECQEKGQIRLYGLRKTTPCECPSKKKPMQKLKIEMKEAKKPVKGKEVKATTSSKYYDKKFIEYFHEKNPKTNIPNLEKVANAFEDAFIKNKLYEVIFARLTEGLSKFRGRSKKTQPLTLMSPEQVAELERSYAEFKARVPELNKFLNNPSVYKNGFFGLWLVNRLLIKDPDALKNIMKYYPKIEANISLGLDKVFNDNFYAINFENAMKKLIDKWKPMKK